MNDNEIIFALDIGTRMVVGIVGIEENKKLKIIAVEQMEHESRAMFDGQVHDIDKVSDVIIKIKEKLERNLNLHFNNVAIAAAGRSLKTQIARVEKNIDNNKEITAEDINNLELSALESAQNIINSQLGLRKYHTVGYTVSNYFLNGLPITNLKGHIGYEIAVEIIATFLPEDVIEGLYAAIKKAGLNVSYITLEPIAAINAAIKPEIRMLNIALVDIGAGTSDIAISKEGNIIAYSMVPYAGDEITETISKYYLTDFNTAEKIKKSNSKEIKFKDILNIEHKISKSDIINIIMPQIKELAKSICNEILKYNQKSPSAVFLVGGTSNLPNLAEEIASILNIPANRVSVRDKNSVEILEYKGKKLTGPESITPIGIAYSAITNKKKDFIKVFIDNKPVKIFNIKQPTIMDALFEINFDPQKLIANSGKDLHFILNGSEKIIHGKEGVYPKIYLNNNIANLKTLIKDNDKITIISSINGEDGYITVKDLLKNQTENIIYVNGIKQNPDYVIKENDIVEIKENNINISVYVNGKIINLSGKNEYLFVDIFNFIDTSLPKNKVPDMLLNGKRASYTDILHNGDNIEIK